MIAFNSVQKFATLRERKTLCEFSRFRMKGTTVRRFCLMQKAVVKDEESLFPSRVNARVALVKPKESSSMLGKFVLNEVN